MLIDFGVAALKERDVGLTEPGHIVGTPAFMAPEQAREVDQLTDEADVYGLGATLVYAVAGHTLYPGVNGWALMMRIAEPHHSPDLSGVPASLESLIAAMLAFDATARPRLGDVRDRMLQLATSGGQKAEELRRRLMELTFDPSTEIKIYDDPVRDPEEANVNTGPDQPEPLAASEGPAEPPEAGAHSGPPKADVTWLVDRLRKQYARRAEL